MSPYDLTYNPDNGNMHVANTGTNSVSVIDSKTNSDKVTNEIMMKDTPTQIVSDENAMHGRGRHNLNANFGSMTRRRSTPNLSCV